MNVEIFERNESLEYGLQSLQSMHSMRHQSIKFTHVRDYYTNHDEVIDSIEVDKVL